MTLQKIRALCASLLTAGMFVALTGCDPGGLDHTQSSHASIDGNSTVGTRAPASRPPRAWSTDALVFAGAGTWGVEVTSLESILSAHGASFQEVTAAQLDSMSVDEISKFGLLVFPGGEGGTIAKSLSADTHARLREAVQVRGVSYIGFCAGAFIAVNPAPSPGGDVSYGLGIVAGAELNYYYLEGQINPDIAMTLETFADGSKHDLVWYGGPVTPNIPGGVIAKYPNGDPAMTEVWSGNGFVIISAVHPAAPQSVRDTFGLKDSDGLDYDLTWSLLDAALNQRALPAF